MKELIKYIKDKKGKISWNSHFIKKYIVYITEQYTKLGLTSKGEYIYYLYNDKTLPNSICKCGKKKKFSSFKNPYREYCSVNCSNKYLMTEERKINMSIKSKETYNGFSEEKKKSMVENQRKTFKENYNEESAKRRSDIMKEIHRNRTYEEKQIINKKISLSLKNSPIAKKQRIERSKLGVKALKEYIKNLKGEELESFKKKQREMKGIKDEDRQLFIEFTKLVRYYTNKDLQEINNIEFRAINFHLDHKFSILEGFKQGISPEIIGSNVNLEIISSDLNCSKGGNCSISKEELISSFEKLIKN